MLVLKLYNTFYIPFLSDLKVRETEKETDTQTENTSMWCTPQMPTTVLGGGAGVQSLELDTKPRSHIQITGIR